jgi:hypothetical protein
MAKQPRSAASEFRRMIGIIAVLGVVMVAGALWYLSLFGPLHTHMVIATIGGVFLSVLLGCGLFAAAFFSDKSGHDESVRDATKGQPE